MKSTSGEGEAHLIKPLTSIRFFAAMAVVIFHSGASFVSVNRHMPSFVKILLLNGYVGVTFFFVLSGFILQLTYRGRIRTTDQIKRFSVARFARLYPVYFLAIIAMWPFTTMAGLGDVPQFLLLHWWIPNGALGWTDWNMPSWTLSVEFFFYLCFPLISRWAVVIGTRWLAIIIFIGLSFDAITAASAVVGNDKVMFSWMHWTPVPLLRLPEFVIGICAAEISLRGNRLPIPSWIAALALVVGLSLSGSPRIAAFATATAVLLISCVARDGGSRFARALSSRWLVVLGGASYSLYLMQQPVHFAIERWLGTEKAVVALQYPVLIIGSLILFFWYEEPMREWIRKRIGMRPSVIEEVT
ncbi:acyltransferase family protein [Sphingomonas asaccharolytica]|uniref:acyltransferase family protein n=1 Tax=Sphingomonas asaccharolytica TaxID=40681 RepID=UPI000A8E5A84|nr:acyltransferase [Sphingomonas asaccharolytica]